MKKWILSIALAFSVLPGARADEGMWLIQCLDKALEKNMRARGCKLAAREIYNEEAGGLSDAVVSLGFYCTGSMISDQGLLITNHHCAYSDVAEISTPEHNYLEDGFFALSMDQEIPIKGKEFYFLNKVLDITEETHALKEQLKAAGQPYGSRRLSSVLEKKYADLTGLEAGFQGMWAGEKYYMCLYTKYTDIRLVGAPPVTVAAFGGDVDNWEWPQHKADFALYRIYDKDGKPLHPRRHLTISDKGYKENSFAMVIGYPGHTNRYASSVEMTQTIEVERPAVNELRRRQLDIIRKWMDADPAIRMKYSDAFFGLSNVAELQEGEYQCVHRFGVIERRRAQEAAMVDDRELLDLMEKERAATSEIELQKVYYREALVRGLIISRTFMRMGSAPTLEKQRAILEAGLEETDIRVEKDLLTNSLEAFLTHIDPRFLKPIHVFLQEKFGTHYKAMAGWLWDNSCLKDAGTKSNAEVAAAFQGNLQDDPLYRYIRELGITEFNQAEEHVADPMELRRQYIRARYRLLERQGVKQYPDANSTMRLTYGRVKPLHPYDAVSCHWQSTAAGLREKYEPTQYDFHYPDAFKAVLPPMDFPVNFLTDLDITGGNSGSPVLDAKGRLIGLAFDGNKESLSSGYEAVDGYNMCVCVDIRYVLWILRHYARQDYVLAELGL